MQTLNGLAVCSITHQEWADDEGKQYKGILMTPIAGKIPNKRILYTPFLAGLENSLNGDCYLMSFYETKIHAKFGRRFQWISLGNIKNSEIPLFIKEIGLPSIFNVENMTTLSIEETNCLVKEKIRYEVEIKYFKARAHSKHMERQQNNFREETENFDDETKGYDIHDITIAFDGDTDSMNEFLGNH